MTNTRTPETDRHEAVKRDRPFTNEPYCGMCDAPVVFVDGDWEHA